MGLGPEGRRVSRRSRIRGVDLDNNARSPAKDGAGQGRIDDIEVLRAVAVGLVLVEHVRLNLLPWVFAQGPLYGNFGFWSGVDLFLAISGFVIARSLLPMLAESRGTMEFFNVTLSFWVRRAWRLLPSAWLWLAVIMIAASAFNRSGAFEPFRSNVESVVAAMLNIANLRTFYVLGRGPTGAAFPYWSLSLEEQFYVVLPLLFFFAGRRLPLVLALAIATQLFIRRIGPDGNVLLNMTKSDGLSLGVLLAMWSSLASYRRLEPTAFGAPPVRLFLLPLFITGFAALSGPHFPDACKVGLIAVLSAAVVWVASYDRDYLFPRGRLKRFMCWMGARSYALYLTHIPAFFAAREIWFRVDPAMWDPSPGHALLLLATGFGLAFALADLNYRFVELPLRRRGARIAERIRRRDLQPFSSAASGASYA
jgi:peptidoglycan/LPS O-acetylase OafA/YrhL